MTIHPPLPCMYEAARANRILDALAERDYVPGGAARDLLTAVFSNSPYLGRLAVKLPDVLRRFFEAGPDSLLHDAVLTVHSADDASSDDMVMGVLRRAKDMAALTIALADLSGQWSLEQVTGALTRFADACVRAALRYALKSAAKNTELAGKSGETLEHTTGMTVIAMGKYGAGELNYSSDIDLVVFFDAELFPFRKFSDARAAAVAVVKHIVKLIDERTPDGYVFRVDLRLRPDPGSTQVAVSLDAAREYYEEMGQNWERAAMIKARHIAGDPRAAEQFAEMIRPFVWRRSLDFAAIEDIHAIKRQIHAVHGGGTIAVAGHNIKIGRGGIREIEFFVQTQQLILGGRTPSLRVPATMAGLKALVAVGVVGEDVASDLADAYRYLRTLEHRLQMTEDAQTHSVGKTPQDVAHIAAFMGYDGAEAFSNALTKVLSSVQAHYARLFETDTTEYVGEGNLVFTGVDHDPDTLNTLKNMGYADPEHVSGAIMKWHRGGTRATHGQHARALLTKLIPPLLRALANTAAPDAAFAQFDRFLTHQSTGVQLFSLLLNQPDILRLVADLCGSAPRLTRHLGRGAARLDAMFDRDFFSPLPPLAVLRANMDAHLIPAFDAGGYEAVLDEARRFVKEQIFRVGVQVIEGVAPAEEAGLAFANVAESALKTLLPYAEAELAQQAGHVPGGHFAVIAMGKLGGQEMTAGSDLDLVFVYDVPDGAEASDGERPLDVPTYYARLAKRYIAALTAMTSVGGLYEVDMRLRPSGTKGPVAVSLTAFRQYHEKEAWTWERLAMTRARPVAGSPVLCETLRADVTEALSHPPPRDMLIRDIRDMRQKVAAQFPGDNIWDLKYAPGGLIDLEFLIQTVMLDHAAAQPEILAANTQTALAHLREIGAFPPGEAQILCRTAKLESALMQVLRIAISGPLRVESASGGLKRLLARAGKTRTFDELQYELMALQGDTHKIFVRYFAE